MIALFGADTPKEAGKDFASDAHRFLTAMQPKYGSFVMVESPWMREQVSGKHPFFLSISFEEAWPSYSRNRTTVLALNKASATLFILPPNTIDDMEFGHRHSIIEQAVIALGLQRPMYCNNMTVLSALVARRIEESAE
jgi:hypothetical protein